MPYGSHTEADRTEMLAAIGLTSVADLFEDVPESLRFPALNLPAPLSEQEVLEEVRTLAERNWDADHHACFLGAGAYNHFIPSVVHHITSRGEFYTSYTPYQPEVSQGTLQATFEYQSMICDLTGMDVANASHYDGGTALAEAIVMAMSVHKGQRRSVIMSGYINPQYREVARTYTQGAHVRFDGEQPALGLADLAARVNNETACVCIQVPDFLGRIPDWADVQALSQAAHAVGALLVVSANPISLGLLKPPAEYGADIVIGEGQPLGTSLSYGGPYLGFFATRSQYVRRMAGRLVGETVDADGKRGYVLTLATREQHIRREKATSNICTNQALNALAAAVYMAAMGPKGLRTVAELCYHKAHYAAAAIASLPGYRVREGEFFNEFVVSCPRPVHAVNRHLLDRGIIGGWDLSGDYPELGSSMLLCVTELNTRAQIDHLVAAMGELS